MASDTSLVFNLIARDRASGEISKFGERVTTASAAIGAGVAGALAVGITSALDVGAANAKLAAQLALGPEQAASMAKVSASVYQNAWGDSTETVNLAIKGVYQNIGDVSKAKGGLEGITTKALALADTFDQDLTMATAAVGQLLRTGLAKDADEAFDIITAGLQSSADKSGDYLETLNEYSTQWRRIGLDAQTATGLLSQGLKAGARDADQVADALGQFGERALAGGKPVDDAFKSIGLSSKTMAKMIGAGGEQAEKALQLTMDKMRGTKDEQVKLNAAAALFGDPGNVLGAALFALDPATAAAASGMDKATGAADRMVDTVGGSAASQLETFKRKAIGELTEVGGAVVGWAMKHQTVVKPLVLTFLALAATVLVVKGAMMVYSAVSAVVAGAHAIISASCWTVIGNWLRMNAIGLGMYARIAGAAVVSAATTSAAWLGSALTSIGTWVAAVVRAGLVAVGQFVMMAARAVVWAATMAAQWLIAMGPIGWIILGVIALAALIYTYWDQIKAATVAAWNAVWGGIKWAVDQIWNFFLTWTLGGIIWQHWDTIKQGAITAWNAIVGWLMSVPGMIYNAFLNFTPIGLMIKHWATIKQGAINGGTAMVNWVRGLPGMISAGIGNLGNLLTDKGRDVVSGLWRGIQSMGGWLRSTLIGWARNLIPGPIAKALGIASPSKVMAELGQWIPAGVVVGIEARQGDVADAMATLVPTPSAGQSVLAGQQLARGAGAAPLTRPGYGPQAVRVIFDFTGAESDLTKLMRKSVRVVGQGSVQTAYGQ
ncbi:phage tail tape measure protein [Streptomyces sp. NBC_01264]|uniref:phage tail tape measure protein n=1 Tax=Streptomyces sp. NBC_01264 TaxID=2903804 RepID=UPI00224F0671|nr:phage tail tape measure protein [Streptomyces sp. NBC_01264]MCX4780053.1 phage tail tape measure protein [Streptomyces sp. NBC_01264]